MEFQGSLWGSACTPSTHPLTACTFKAMGEGGRLCGKERRGFIPHLCKAGQVGVGAGTSVRSLWVRVSVEERCVCLLLAGWREVAKREWVPDAANNHRRAHFYANWPQSSRGDAFSSCIQICTFVLTCWLFFFVAFCVFFSFFLSFFFLKFYFILGVVGLWSPGVRAATFFYAPSAPESAAAAEPLTWAGAHGGELPHMFYARQRSETEVRLRCWGPARFHLRSHSKRNTCGSDTRLPPAAPQDNQLQEEAPNLLLFIPGLGARVSTRFGVKKKCTRAPLHSLQMTCWRNKRHFRRRSARKEAETKSLCLDIERSGACGYWLLSFPSASWMVSVEIYIYFFARFGFKFRLTHVQVE